MFQKNALTLFFFCVAPLVCGSEGKQPPDISKISLPILMQAQRLVENRKKESLVIPIIAIAGCSAVGKSEFSRALCHVFDESGLKAVILQQDNFMNPLEVVADHLINSHLDHKKIYDILQRIKKGETHLRKPKLDWTQRAVVYEDLDLANVDIILFEGIYVLCGKESYDFFGYSDMRIFIDAQEDDIIAWNWQRELASYGDYIPRSREKFDQDVAWDMADYRRNILPTKEHADFVIEKDKNHNYALVVCAKK